jgi:hypothetical protein
MFDYVVIDSEYRETFSYVGGFDLKDVLKFVSFEKT